MNPVTEKKRQWLWFAALWCAGLVAVLTFSYVYKWLMAHL